jgi:ATP-dependent DNA helicase DinG
MLNDSLKEEIQSAYSRLLDEQGFKPRHCQKAMIAEIARTLGGIGDEPGGICVVEAGTGTGKTIAYALAVIPLAKQLKKKIVVATATVALQEQIVYQDLPDIRASSGLDFSFALAKGRRRYLCLSRLDRALQDGSSVNQTLSFFEEGDTGNVSKSDGSLYEEMINGLGHGTWDGDRDNWPEEIDHVAWSRVSTDHAQCTQRQCTHFENCIFYRAREKIHRVDCIVTNQDLVLADLMMGGGAVLPAPEETIYIFDECHHLPEKAGNHFSHNLSLYSTRSWLQQIPGSLDIVRGDVVGISENQIAKIERQVESASQLLDDAAAQFQVLKESAETIDDGWRYRFPEGRVDPEHAENSARLATVFSGLSTAVDAIGQEVEDVLENAGSAEREQSEQWLSLVTAMGDRLIAATALWRNYAEPELNPPYARWVKFTTAGQIEGLEIQLASHPVSVAGELEERLWSRCAGAVLTSATISVARDFSVYQAKSGIEKSQTFVSLSSPFRFQEQAVLRIPQMEHDPGNADAHTEELGRLIPDLLGDEGGALVLFTSWRQMLRVYDEINQEFRGRVLLQGDLSKQEILKRHRDKVDAGEASCIFGLASFAEGVDLPGDYCSHVVIAKLPFSVPDDPVDATLSEWIERQGGNAFYDLMLPNAALRVVQAAGRLLRTETDSGTVSILDRRVITKSYGRLILDSLPPFRRDF